MTTSTDGSAYVRSHYNYNSTDRSSGTGALVGLVYMDSSNARTVVQNCSVSGYEVTYNTGTMTSNCAVGGLVGYNMGEISNSSAVCKLVQATVTYQNSNTIASIGGLVGSNYNTISKSYAGGRLWYDDTNNNSNAPVEIGGLAGKCSYLWTTKTNFVNTITDCYSYSNIPSVGSGTRFKYYGVSVRNIDTRSEQYVPAHILTMTNCYYLSATATATIVTQTGAAPRDYTGLSSLSIPGFSKATAANSHPFTAALVGSAFPFLAIVTADGSVVHYGDWYAPGITGVSQDDDPDSAAIQAEEAADAAIFGEDEMTPGEETSVSGEDKTGPTDNDASSDDDMTTDPEQVGTDSGVIAGGLQ